MVWFCVERRVYLVGNGLQGGMKGRGELVEDRKKNENPGSDAICLKTGGSDRVRSFAARDLGRGSSSFPTGRLQSPGFSVLPNKQPCTGWPLFCPSLHFPAKNGLPRERLGEMRRRRPRLGVRGVCGNSTLSAGWIGDPSTCILPSRKNCFIFPLDCHHSERNVAR